MIDLHSHVLPGIDDGAANVGEALDLAAGAAEDGTRVLAATPHLRHDHPGVRPEELPDRCEELNGRLGEAGIELEVVAGGELDLDWAEQASDDVLRLVSYGGRGTDLLVETPYGSLAPGFEERLLGLTGRGFRALLAHPERSPSFRRDPGRVAELVAAGILVQLTARSVVPGAVADEVGEVAVALMSEGLAHVLASDAHSARGPGPYDLAAGVAAAWEIVGERARSMAADWPAAILSGAPLPAAPGSPPPS